MHTYVHCTCNCLAISIPLNHFKLNPSFSFISPAQMYSTSAPGDLHWRECERRARELSLAPSLSFALHLTCICRYIGQCSSTFSHCFCCFFVPFLSPSSFLFFLSAAVDVSAYVSVFSFFFACARIV